MSAIVVPKARPKAMVLPWGGAGAGSLWVPALGDSPCDGITIATPSHDRMCRLANLLFIDA